MPIILKVQLKMPHNQMDIVAIKISISQLIMLVYALKVLILILDTSIQ